MKYKLQHLIRSIAVGAVASIYPNPTEANSTEAVIDSWDPDISEREQNDKLRIKNLELKLLLKPGSELGKWEMFSHRSHRSHSSHSSHRSHYSSRTGGTSNGSSSGSSSSSSGGSGTYTYPSGTVVSQPLQLGSRILSVGMEGEDVTELILLLKGRGLIKVPEDYQLKTRERFTSTIEDAVKLFQKDKGISADGMVGPTTLYHLKYK